MAPSPPPLGEEVLDPHTVGSLHRLDGVPGAVADLIALFVSSGRASLTELAEAVQSGDRSAAAAAAHRLKGSSANLGAVRVSTACRLIEEQIRTGGAAAALATAHSAYDEACSALHAEFGAR